ncbi:TetR family transcriptional regulator C-terminal domain-containing protein [Thermopolyspora sp. NPDC052614]|uniref:TetR/AcrR family transcriptional regulator n=1 Tax=Thermopolyspora sp. NPDC052614 TaxID=3155682 RepID=UPI003425BA79
MTPRAELIADTAIALLAERGMRGLTHRAVDEAAGLPPGSTSNLARTRAALLELTLTRMTELEFARIAAIGAPETAPDLDALAAMMAEFTHLQLTAGRVATVARYELALEATRRPELRKVYDEAGRSYRRMAADLLAAAGSADPVRHGHQLVAFLDGLLFDAIAGAGETFGRDDLRRGIREVLAGMLGR